MYLNKYLKYKNKYLNNKIGGSTLNECTECIDNLNRDDLVILQTLITNKIELLETKDLKLILQDSLEVRNRILSQMLVPFRELDDTEIESNMYAYYNIEGESLGGLVEFKDDIKKYVFENDKTVSYLAHQVLIGPNLDNPQSKEDFTENTNKLQKNLRKLGECTSIQVNPENPKSFVYEFEKSYNKFTMADLLTDSDSQHGDPYKHHNEFTIRSESLPNLDLLSANGDYYPNRN